MKFKWRRGVFALPDEVNTFNLKRRGELLSVETFNKAGEVTGEEILSVVKWFPTRPPGIMRVDVCADVCTDKVVHKCICIEKPQLEMVEVVKFNRGMLNSMVERDQVGEIIIDCDFDEILMYTGSAFEQLLDSIIMGNMEWGRLDIKRYSAIGAKDGRILVKVLFKVKKLREWRAEMLARKKRNASKKGRDVRVIGKDGTVQ